MGRPRPMRFDKRWWTRCGFDVENRCGPSLAHWPMMTKIGPKAVEYWRRWTIFVRGDIYRLRAPRDVRGSEQQGSRFAVVVQSDDLMLSTLLVAPTSRSAQPRMFRPTITILDEKTQVLVEQTSAVAPDRLGQFVGRVTFDELTHINEALRLALELD